LEELSGRDAGMRQTVAIGLVEGETSICGAAQAGMSRLLQTDEITLADLRGSSIEGPSQR